MTSPQPELDEIGRIRAEYDRRAREIPRDFYGWQRVSNRYHHTQVYRKCIDALVREGFYPMDDLSIADIGCGRGSWLLEFSQWGAKARNLAGIDLDASRIEYARERLPLSDLRVGDARKTGWTSASFDVVSQFGMFTSVLSADIKKELAAEMQRVVKPSGMIVWFDFRANNPSNANVRGIDAAEIRFLFAGCRVRIESLILAPPIARRLVPLSWILGLAAEKLPFLRTHYLAVIRKP